MNFIKSVGKLLNTYLFKFQTEKPLIHVQHVEMMSLVETLLRRFMKQSFVDESKLLFFQSIDFDEHDHKLPIFSIEIGEEARVHLISNFPEKTNRKEFLYDCRKFYCSLVKYLCSHFPLSNVTMIDLGLLSPDSKQHPKDAVLSLTRLASKLKHTFV